MPATSHRLIANAAWNVLGRVTSVLSTLVGSALVARSLGPEAMGIYSLVRWMRLTIADLLDLGLASAMTRFVAEMSGRGEQRSQAALARFLLRAQFAIATMALATLTLLAAPIARLLGQPEIAALIPVAALALAFSMMAGVVRAWLVAMHRFQGKAAVDIASAVLSLGGILVVTWGSFGVRGLLWSEAIGGILEVGILAALALIGCDARRADGSSDRVAKRQLVSYCAGYFLITSMDIIIWQRSETFFLGRLSVPQEIAFYSLAFTLTSGLFGVLPSSISSVLFPAFSERIGAGDWDALASAYRGAVRFNALICLPLFALAIGLAQPVISVLYGPSYAPVAGLVQILAIGAVVIGVTDPGSALFLALGRPLIAVVWSVPLAALNLALAYALVQWHGATGAALANIASQLTGIAIGTSYTLHLARIRFPFADITRVAVAALAMGATASMVSAVSSVPLAVPIAVAASLLVYIVALRHTGAFAPQDFTMLEAVVTRLPRPLSLPCARFVTLAEGFAVGRAGARVK